MCYKNYDNDVDLRALICRSLRPIWGQLWVKGLYRNCGCLLYYFLPRMSSGSDNYADM